jgi:hypothetical protein
LASFNKGEKALKKIKFRSPRSSRSPRSTCSIVWQQQCTSYFKLVATNRYDATLSSSVKHHRPPDHPRGTIGDVSSIISTIGWHGATARELFPDVGPWLTHSGNRARFWGLGLYEAVRPPVWVRFFHTDYTHTMQIMLSFLVHGKCSLPLPRHLSDRVFR